MKRKYYRIVLINTQTGARRLLNERYSSHISAENIAKNFCAVMSHADYEIKEEFV